MKKIPRPAYGVETVIRDCFDFPKNSGLTNKLKRIAPSVVRAEASYIECAEHGQLHTISPLEDVDGIVTSDEMTKVYEQKFSNIKGPGRRYYDKLMAAPALGRCPLCDVGTVSTLDHYLPKKQFPAFAVTPANLVPSCRDCNLGQKRTEAPKSAETAPLHPYFDDVETAVWLKVDLYVSGDSLVPRYGVVKPDAWDDVLYRRTLHHMELYGLYKLYGSHAAEEISGRARVWRSLYGESGAKQLKEQFSLDARSYEEVSLNSWKSALFRALFVQSDTVCRWLEMFPGDTP